MKQPLLAGTAVSVVAIAVAYARWLRPWQMRWGATDEDVARAMPLDERIAYPTTVSTRAVTVNAPPQEIWPWLAQMGDRERAGYYSYVWIERLMGMKIENANRVLPQFQELRAGDALDRNGTMCVQALDPESWLVLGPNDAADSWMDVTWAFALYPVDHETTRLVTRVRAKVKRWSPLAAAWMGVMDPGVFVMERKMLLGIKRRAERLAAEHRQAVAAATDLI